MIIMIGPLPPPVHGNSKNFEIAVNDVSRVADVVVVSTSPGILKKGIKYHARKFFMVLFGILIIVKTIIKNKVYSVYMPPDGGIGLIYTIIFSLIIRMTDAKIYFHHRSFAYIDKKSFIMVAIKKIVGKNAEHIFLCDCMRDRYENKYGNDLISSIVSNSQYVSIDDDMVGRKIISDKKIRIGFLSNISEEKGIVSAVESLRTLLEDGIDVELIVGGAPENSWAENYISDCASVYGDSFNYIGYVDKSKKTEFYKSIDVLVFPSKYKNEAQPNVVFEALSFGVPVISTDRGCVPSDLICGGVVVPESEDFSKEVLCFVRRSINENKFYENFSSEGVKNLRLEIKKAKKQYSDLINKIVAGQ